MPTGSVTPATPGGGGADGPNTADRDGQSNTGGGGGGARNTSGTSGSGGSGVVIVRYSGSQSATGGTVTSSGGNTIHTFTGDGTFAVGAGFSIN
jgi:hypothetical protein